MTDVGIIGAGYSGLTLALRLQQLGIAATLYAEATPDAMRDGRLPNTVGRFPHTTARERELGVAHWDDPGASSLQFHAGPPFDVGYEGRFTAPIQATDFRVLLPRLVEDYASRGGRVVIAPEVTAAAIDARARDHDLVVVAVGRRSIDELFPVDRQRSPYAEPQRLVFAGLFSGLNLPERAVSLNLSPGAGEVVQMPMRTAHGMGTNLLVNAVPGGPLAPVATTRVDDDRFVPMLVELLRVHAPAVAARIQPATFALTGARDWVQGAITPSVRRGWSELPSGRLAIAVGDAWITNDPITAQGANLGSHSAWVTAEHIAAGGPFDAGFGARLEEAMWDYGVSVTAFTNAFLQPPPPHVIELIMAAATHQSVADRYVSLFNDPRSMWHTLSSPDTTRAFIGAALAGEHAA